MKKTILYVITFLLIVTGLGFHFAQVNPQSIFTPEEREWLLAHPVISVAPDPNYAPVEFYENGTFRGLSVDYLNWIGKTYNIQFEYVYYDSWSEIMEALRSGAIQLQTGIIKTPDRDKYLSFTDPYSDMPSVLMIRKDFKEPLNDHNLFDYKVGLIKDFAVEEYMISKYHPEEIYEIPNVKEALESLSTGKVDILVLDIGQATYYVNKMGLTNVMITNDVKIDFAIQLSFATKKDQSILTSIMDKALKTMPSEIQQSYANKWLGIGEFTTFDSKLLSAFLTILGAISLLFIVVSVWLFTLRRKDNELAKVNAQLQEQIIALSEAQHQLVEMEKISALSRLAIGLSHEINTPIGNGISIISYIQTLVHDLRAGLQKQTGNLDDIALQIQESSGIALRSVQRAAKILQDFHAVANYQLDTTEKEIDLSRELEQIAAILASHETMKSDLALEIEASIHTVMSYNILLQLLSALMENSFLHGYGKNVGPVEIGLHTEDGCITLIYKDYGKGIKEQELPKIFEPFYSTQRGSEERIGLGLYNVYNIVNHVLGGKIVATSDGLCGTTFTIQFPIKKRP